jgi:hypothetical protein
VPGKLLQAVLLEAVADLGRRAPAFLGLAVKETYLVHPGTKA